MKEQTKRIVSTGRLKQ